MMLSSSTGHFNRPLKAFQQRLRAAGKPARLALIAIMRKLLTVPRAQERLS